MQFLPKTLALAAAVCVAGAAHADILTFTGSTAGGPTFDRPVADFSGPSAFGTGVSYHTYVFSVGTSGDYSFLTTGTFDTFSFLYSPSFSAASPLDNGIVGNDDLVGLTTSGFQATLTAGDTYVLVTTGFEAAEFGSFSTTIGGPGVISAVPEPASWALLLAGGLGVAGLARRRKAAVQQA